MIRRLTAEDDQQVFSFLRQDPSFNLFIIGDIESFGYDADFQDVWGQFDDAGSLKAVLLRYYDSYIPYAPGDFDADGFARLIRETAPSSSIQLSGKADIARQFEERLPLGEKRTLYFCECRTDEYARQEMGAFAVKKAELADVDRILDLRRRIAEFETRPSSRDMLVKGMETNSARTYYIEQDGRMVAAASTSAENSLSAMIVGVCTDQEHRGKGYASTIVAKLVCDLLAEGKMPCLFYDNPDAGRIYHRLGFRDIGLWAMYR
ncbi:GNAT family N-acetyltransferase [Anoxybacillus geothermalis]|uniref:GNAT family N-acetyltransferase n=1 Tax=Geobacillus zalihae TaxID=213419 RepID=A0A1V9BYG5_9BACL|nr:MULTISPECIES: GNAT family N-acetyltransferase [Geobacillus]MED5074040.1 GNAT family N-acetyltransferase [Anoxybacillus geothermalis]MCG6793884.1 GNAT family N-acetyltransferase [Geobacillus sp. YHL]OQP14397.1 N-acetyltransferase [Geobacillus zalihae]OQP23833.1 N-acetyltransferase [Geobacillus zalihae]PJW17670.1 N-acetyltransferase [Geobacillus sp. WSUCF-018B]